MIPPFLKSYIPNRKRKICTFGIIICTVGARVSKGNSVQKGIVMLLITSYKGNLESKEQCYVHKNMGRLS